MYPIFLVIITLQVILLWLVFTVGSLLIKPRAMKHMVDILYISTGCKISRSEPDI